MLRHALLAMLIGCAWVFLSGCESKPNPMLADDWYVGVWAARDSDGDLFDINIYANGTASTNWIKGEQGFKGETGTWTKLPDGILITYDSGWRDALRRVDGKPLQEGFAPGTDASGKPTNSAVPARVEEPKARYIGIWQTTNVVTGEPLYFAIFSDGSAVKSAGTPASGKWAAQISGGWIQWTDGWKNRLVQQENVWRSLVWRPEQTVGDTQPEPTKAVKLGMPE